MLCLILGAVENTKTQQLFLLSRSLGYVSCHLLRKLFLLFDCWSVGHHEEHIIELRCSQQHKSPGMVTKL